MVRRLLLWNPRFGLPRSSCQQIAAQIPWIYHLRPLRWAARGVKSGLRDLPEIPMVAAIKTAAAVRTDLSAAP
jgi:hypothetical protein